MRGIAVAALALCAGALQVWPAPVVGAATSEDRPAPEVVSSAAYAEHQSDHVATACLWDPGFRNEAGHKVQVVYAHTSATPDPAALATIDTSLERIDSAFINSAGRTGGHRVLRWATEPGSPLCHVRVRTVRIGTGASGFAALRSELQAAGAISVPATGAADPTPTKFLVFTEGAVEPDSASACGTATSYLDDSPDGARPGGNLNLRSSVAAVPESCWDQLPDGGSAPARQLMRALGAVQPSAPHHAEPGSCSDGRDLLCVPPTATTPCPAPSDRALFDCGNDDYFNTDPIRGQYLCDHWNTADSRYFQDRTAVQPARAVTTLRLTAGVETLAVSWGDTASCRGADFYKVVVGNVGWRYVDGNSTSFAVPPGNYTVSVRPVRIDESGEPLLGDARADTLRVPNFAPTSGIVLSLTDGRGYGALVYAIDPETNRPVDIRMTVNGGSAQVYRPNYTWADMPRYTGLDHTEALVVLAQLPPGTNEVCFQALDPTAFTWSEIGCRTHTVK
jgi:hypothetical protein